MDSAIQKSFNKNLLEKYSPKNCMLHAGKVKTIEQAMSSKAPSVASFQREHGRQFTEGLITFWLMYLNKFKVIVNLANTKGTATQTVHLFIQALNQLG